MKPQHNSKDAGTVVAQSKKDRGGRSATVEGLWKVDFKRNQMREKRDQWRNKQSRVKTAFETDREA